MTLKYRIEKISVIQVNDIYLANLFGMCDGEEIFLENDMNDYILEEIDEGNIDKEDLESIVKKLNHDLNYVEESQATNEVPIVLFEKEKEYLVPVNYEILENYCLLEKTYKVSNESMISYCGSKYSVPLQYVGKQLTVIDILKHSSFNTKTEEEINEYIKKNLYSLDRINIDKGDNK